MFIYMTNILEFSPEHLVIRLWNYVSYLNSMEKVDIFFSVLLGSGCKFQIMAYGFLVSSLFTAFVVLFKYVFC